MAYKPILCLDFDGVVHSYTSGWKGPRNIPDRAMPGALEFIVKAQESFKVSIFSSRSNYLFGRHAMKKWLFAEYDKLIYLGLNKDDAIDNIPEWFTKLMFTTYTLDPIYIIIDDTIKSIIKNIDFPKHKPPALITVDDRCFKFEGKWPTVEYLENFKPWKVTTK